VFLSSVLVVLAPQISSQIRTFAFPFIRKVCKLINVHLERLQLSQSEGSKTIGQWYRRYLRIGWESKFPSLVDLQDWLREKPYASGMRRCGRYESMGNTIVQLRDPFSSGSMVAEENPISNHERP
jgi:hypothetical protein